jgi:hypothetical protein
MKYWVLSWMSFSLVLDLYKAVYKYCLCYTKTWGIQAGKSLFRSPITSNC